MQERAQKAGDKQRKGSSECSYQARVPLFASLLVMHSHVDHY